MRRGLTWRRPGSGLGQRFVVFVTGAVGFAAAVFLSITLARPLQSSRAAALILCAAITVIGLRPIFRALRGRPDEIWHPLSYFSGLYVLYFGIGPIPALWRAESLDDSRATVAYALSLFFCLVGLVAAQAGCSLMRWVRHDAPKEPAMVWDRRASLVFLSLLLAFVWWERVQLNALGVFFKGAVRVGEVAAVDRLFVLWQPYLAAAIVALATYARYRLGFRRGFMGIACVAAVATELAYWFLINTRTQTVLLLVSAGIVATTAGVRLRLRWVLLAGIVFVGAVYPLGGMMRGVRGEFAAAGYNADDARVTLHVMPEAMARLEGGYLEFFNSDLERDYQSVRLNGVNMMAAVVYQHVFRGAPLLSGEAFLYGLPMNVPRIFWPSKPERDLDVEGFINYRFGLPIHDTMISPPTEFYSDFGILGVGVQMFLWGALLSLAHFVLVERSRSPVGLITYAAVITSLIIPEQSFVDGVLGNVKGGVVLWMFLCVVGRLIQFTGHLVPARAHPAGARIVFSRDRGRPGFGEAEARGMRLPNEVDMMRST